MTTINAIEFFMEYHVEFKVSVGGVITLDDGGKTVVTIILAEGKTPFVELSPYCNLSLFGLVSVLFDAPIKTGTKHAKYYLINGVFVQKESSAVNG